VIKKQETAILVQIQCFW